MLNTRTLYIPEILDLVDSAPGPKEKAKVLVEHRSPALGTLLAYTYDLKFQMLLSEKEIDEALAQPYKKERAELGMAPTHLFKEYKRLHLFVKPTGTARALNNKKLQLVLIQMREALHPSEFDIVVKMLKRQSLARGLTPKLLRDTFPSLLSPEKA